MSVSDPKSLSGIGFLTVVELPAHGLCGGLLVVNAAARPLEFHCTAPVKANRAQEILYGQTLRPYLCGEQISQALLAKMKVAPAVVFTDCEHVLPLREFVAHPVVLVQCEETASASDGEPAAMSHLRIDRGHAGAPRAKLLDVVKFRLGEQAVGVHKQFAHDREDVTTLWEPHTRTFDLAEPFERIREAIAEAHNVNAEPARK